MCDGRISPGENAQLASYLRTSSSVAEFSVETSPLPPLALALPLSLHSLAPGGSETTPSSGPVGFGQAAGGRGERKKERKHTTQGRDGRTARRHHVGILDLNAATEWRDGPAAAAAAAEAARADAAAAAGLRGEGDVGPGYLGLPPERFNKASHRADPRPQPRHNGNRNELSSHRPRPCPTAARAPARRRSQRPCLQCAPIPGLVL